MKKFLYLLMLSIIQLIMNSNAYSQIGIGPTNFTPNASAGLDINFVDKGLLIPRVDLSNYLLTIAANAPGLMVYNTNAAYGSGTGFYYNTSVTTIPTWVKFGSALGSGTANQVAFWSSGTTLSGSPGLKWDNTNSRLGIGAFPDSKLMVSNGTVTTFAVEAPSQLIGLYNTLAGVSAGISMTNGADNTVFGAMALRYCTSGQQNTASGYQALYSDTTGSYNTANGLMALYHNITGNKNTAVGEGALFSNTTANNSVAVGYNALRTQTGNATDNDLNNVAIGNDALYSDNPTNQANARYNVAVGNEALSSNTTGIQNTATGYEALLANTLGDNNIALGSYALASNTSGNNSIAIGTQALAAQTGYTSANMLGNIAVGKQALFLTNPTSGTNGRYNVAVGNMAGNAVTTGYLNTLVGHNAGYSGTYLQGGNSNVMIGSNTNAGSLNRTNAVLIGNNAVSTADNQVMLGDTNMTTFYCRGATFDTAAPANMVVDGKGKIMQSTLSSVTGSGLAGKIAYWNGTGTLTKNNTLVWDNSDGVMGIGTSSPSVTAKLDVESTKQYAAYFASNDVSDPNSVIYAQYTGTNYSGDVVAVRGKSAQNDGWGYGGKFEGGYTGVRGSVTATGNTYYYGAYGDAEGGTGSNCGAEGYARGATLANYGIYGDAEGGTSSTTNMGIYGYASGPGTLWAGYFQGDVDVVGTLFKGGGGFKIDHPLDPENKYLYHSFVESPDMKNIYDGVIILDAGGSGTVELPLWFETLNKDFRYQLTAIGAPGPNLYIAEEVHNNMFRIAGGQPGSKVSWQVTGIRKDPFAEKNRIPVEADKPAGERGK